MFSDPEHNIEQFDLQSGSRVADCGSGSGFYTIAAARAVGSAGRVYAIDVQKDLLERTKRNAMSEGFGNVEVLWGDIEKQGGTRLRESSVDAVIFSNVLFQLSDKKTPVLEAKRILKPNGKVLVVDWRESFGNLGPTPEMVFSAEDAKKLFPAEGFLFDREISAGEHHYGLVFKRN